MLTAALSLWIIPVCLAGPLRGVVKDKLRGETLIGSVVQVKGEKHNVTTTGLDGSFLLKDLPNEGIVTIVATYIGYKPIEIQVNMCRYMAVVTYITFSTSRSPVTISTIG